MFFTQYKMLFSRKLSWVMLLCLSVVLSTLLVLDSLFVLTVSQSEEQSEETGKFFWSENASRNFIDYTRVLPERELSSFSHPHHHQKTDTVTVVLVVCGEKDDVVQQTVTALKSLALLTRSTLHAIVIVDSSTLEDVIGMQVQKWPKHSQSMLKLSFRSVWYPKDYAWMKNYRTLCTTERLYIPTILPEEDAVIYLDTDIILLDNVKDLWSYFYRMDSSQIAAMAPEHEVPENAFYNSPYNKIPHYGSLGLNAGVLLMNLTRMRSFPGGWTNLVHEIYEKYKYSPLHFADQDILNIIFYMFPDKLLELPCKWNFRSDHCGWKVNTCPSAENEGVSLLHGNRNVFHNMRDLTFRSVYKVFLNYSWDPQETENFADSLTTLLKKEYNTFCGTNHSIYVSRLSKILNSN